ADDVCCQKTSLSFVDSVWEMFGPLLRGVPTVIIPAEAVKDMNELIGTLAVNRVTRLVLVPSLLRALLESHLELVKELPKFQFWVSSGEACPVELLRRFKDAMPGRTLVNLYGSSEVAADVTHYDASVDNAGINTVAIGRPISNTQIYLLNSYLEPVAVGVPGEIYIGGDGLSRGYLRRPGMTADK